MLTIDQANKLHRELFNAEFQTNDWPSYLATYPDIQSLRRKWVEWYFGGVDPNRAQAPVASGLAQIPIVGPLADSIGKSIGISPTIVLLVGGLGAAWMLGIFDGKRR